MNTQSALYIVATPIGNLSDITLRALDVLKQVSLIAAEDTRHSAKLMHFHGINTPMCAYHDHSTEAQMEQILARLAAGESVALVSDAGTPLISDPGYRLVASARARNITVIPVPGPSALITALCAAGLPSDRFSFEGFPPARHSARVTLFTSLADDPRTLVFYESTHRIKESLIDMSEVFGGTRPCVIARELTKTFETFLAGTLQEVIRQVDADSNQQRGEFVVLLAGCEVSEAEAELNPETQRILSVLLDELPLKQAAALTAKICGEKKNKVYQFALEQKS